MNTKRHIHADVIHAWAEGAEIEYKDEDLNAWILSQKPSWFLDIDYRVKQEKAPDVVRYVKATDKYTDTCKHNNGCCNDNLRLTFCGETGKLIKADVL